MSYGAKILKNASWLLAATTLQKLLAFVSFTLAARWMGKEQTGVFFYAVSITSIAVVLADLGMTPVVIRAIAGTRGDGSRLLGAALRMKCVFAPVAIIVALISAISLGADRVTMITVMIACGVMTADTVNLILYGTLRGKQNLRPEAFGMFIGQVLSSSLAILVASLGYGPIGLACALLLGSSWNVGWAWWQIRRLNVTIDKPERQDFKNLFHQALPFAIAGMAVKVYSYVDSIMIKAFHGTGAVGLYAVSYKLTYALQFLPLTFTAALYPSLASAYANKDEVDLQRVFVGSLRLMAVVGFPLSAGLSALAPRIIPILYGSHFEGAIPAFSILPWVLLPIFMDFPIGALLNATHRAHLKTTAMVTTMFLNVALNALLVPTFGPVGAAWAGVVSFWTLYFIGVGFTLKDAGGPGVLFWLTLRALVVAGLSWCAWRIIGGYLPLPASIIFGGATALGLAFVVRLLSAQDVYRVLSHFHVMPERVESIHD